MSRHALYRFATSSKRRGKSGWAFGEYSAAVIYTGIFRECGRTETACSARIATSVLHYIIIRLNTQGN